MLKENAAFKTHLAKMIWSHISQQL